MESTKGALTRQEAESLSPADLNRAVERYVVGRNPCECGAPPSIAEGHCTACGGELCLALWCQSEAAAARLRSWVAEWHPRDRRRFLDQLGRVLALRLAVARIDPALYVLLAGPEDVARAAVLARLEG